MDIETGIRQVELEARRQVIVTGTVEFIQEALDEGEYTNIQVSVVLGLMVTLDGLRMADEDLEQYFFTMLLVMRELDSKGYVLAMGEDDTYVLPVGTTQLPPATVRVTMRGRNGWTN